MFEKIEKYFLKNKIPKFRFNQFEQAIFEQAISNFDEITVYPKYLRNELNKKFKINSMILIETYRADDTVKFIFKTEDGNFIESVLMLHNDGRRTVCVSCQVFCAVGCKFCATGANQFTRNLNLNEIIEQVLFIIRYLKHKTERVSNIVFMGMGEPFLNFENVIKSINILKEKIGIGAKHITVSTCGIIENIYKFADLNTKTRLAISLHAPNEELRSKLMPINDKYSLKNLIIACDYFTNKTNKRISYEYVLIKNINDSIKYANQLSKLLKGKLAYVNLLIYNPHEFAKFKKPDIQIVKNFKEILENNKIEVSIRKSMGDDISGACGQLSGKQLNKS